MGYRCVANGLQNISNDQLHIYGQGERTLMESFWAEFLGESKRVLLLQGPIGPFFTHLQSYLVEKQGKTVFKLNFNGGDQYYAPLTDHVFNYEGSDKEFTVYLHNFIKKHHIDAVVCFGDGRIYHKLAKEYCHQSGNVTFWAFEEGYLRPHYITFEKWGVNYNSTLCRTKERYDHKLVSEHIGVKKEERELLPVAASFAARAKMAARYYYEMWRHQSAFSQYQHHRERRLRVYAGAWLKTGLLKPYYHWKDRHYAKLIRENQLGKFFIFPLQVHNDNQIIRHGRGLSMPAYIRKVIHSFALNAPKDHKLVIKHHPMDRGFSDYSRLIHRLAKRKGVLDRVIYLHEISMPDLLRSAEGMVVINSTSGISALIHGLPTKVIGDAHYDIPNLTSQLPLREFWSQYVAPQQKCVQCYLDLLREKTQLNGSFYYLDQLCVQEFQ